MLVLWTVMHSKVRSDVQKHRSPPTLETSLESSSQSASTQIHIDSLKKELADIERAFVELSPSKIEAYQKWRQPGNEVDGWIRYLSSLSGWQQKPEGQSALLSLQHWSDADDGQPKELRQSIAARARQHSVVNSIKIFLTDPDTADSTRSYLEWYSNESSSVDELKQWDSNMHSLPPRTLVKEILAGNDVQDKLSPESGIPNGVLDYLRLDFNYSFRNKLVNKWLEDSKPQSLRDITQRWEDLNKRRFDILRQLGYNPRDISKY